MTSTPSHHEVISSCIMLWNHSDLPHFTVYTCIFTVVLMKKKTFQFLYGFASVWEHFPEFHSIHQWLDDRQRHEAGGWWGEFCHTTQCWDGLHWRQRDTPPPTTTTREQQTSCRSFWRRRRRRRRGKRICRRRWRRWRKDKVAVDDRLHYLLLQQILQRTPGPLYAHILLLYVLQSNPNIYNDIFIKTHNLYVLRLQVLNKKIRTSFLGPDLKDNFCKAETWVELIITIIRQWEL